MLLLIFISLTLEFQYLSAIVFSMRTTSRQRVILKRVAMIPDPNQQSLFPDEVVEVCPAPEPKKTRGASSLTKQKQAKAATVVDELAQQVYEYWCMVMRPGRKRIPQLDTKRMLAVKAAIHDFGIEECMRAIDGCAKSDFHMGRNKQNKRYDDIELILRDQEHIERFIGYCNKADGEQGADW